MGKAYAREPDNISKSCKARSSNIRVHFKVNIIVIKFGFTAVLT